MKYIVPEGCTDLSLGGANVEIVDGVIEVEGHHTFLVENGFTPIHESPTNSDGGETLPTIEELKKEADELGIQYAKNIGDKALFAKIQEFKAKQGQTNSDGGEA